MLTGLTTGTVRYAAVPNEACTVLEVVSRFQKRALTER